MKARSLRKGTAAGVATAACFLAVFGVTTAQAASLTVNTTSDTPVAGTCTLREAITSANNNTDQGNCVAIGTYGDDTITFSVSGTIGLGGSQLAINPVMPGTLT